MTAQHMIAPGQYNLKEWTPERVAHAARLWREGFSAHQISRALGGVSRNAVIGKMHRIGMPGHTVKVRVSPVRIKRVKAHKSPVKLRSPLSEYLAKIEPTPIPPSTSDTARVSFQALEQHHCRWPVGDPKTTDFGFCGYKPVPGLPYCIDHARRAYRVQDHQPKTLPTHVQTARVRTGNGNHTTSRLMEDA